MDTDLPIRLTPAATADIRAGAIRYAAEEPGLEHRFQRAVAAGLLTIAASPSAFRTILGEIRRLTLDPFPYGIYYRVHKGEVRVVAVCHLRRSTAAWRKRAND